MAAAQPAHPGYVAQTPETLPALLSEVPLLRDWLGGDPSAWSIERAECGDLNAVFRIHGPAGGLALKQAQPSSGRAQRGAALPLSRVHFEQMALRAQARFAPGLVPEVVHYDEANALIVMELLEPHVALRLGVMGGPEFPAFPETLSTFCAQTLFRTSDIALTSTEKKAMCADFAGNTALCKVSEDLIFTAPYADAARSEAMVPHLAQASSRVRHDPDLKLAAARLKLRFLSAAEALLHGGLHRASVLVTPDDTRVIGPEFARVGPMGFDLGAVLARLLLGFFARSGHDVGTGAGEDAPGWPLAAAEPFWRNFRRTFLGLWESEASGDAYPKGLFADGPSALRLAAEREAYSDHLFQDTVGFAGAHMIAAVLAGAAPTDFGSIEDPERRLQAETRALGLARLLMVDAQSFRTVDALVAAAKRYGAWAPASA